MQNPAAFTSLGHFVGLISRQLKAELGNDSSSNVETLDGLYQHLTQVNEVLAGQDQRLVLALDEFENMDQKIGDGVFPLDLLATLRESIQSHRRLIWVFVGSHPITELTNAEWPSYLVSAQTIEIPPFSLAETKLLLTDPLKQSPLYARDADRRPRLDASFWGKGGMEWIHEKTAGWPHLVQLLASTAVDLANESEANGLDQEMLEQVAEKSVVLGDTVLRQLVHGESKTDAEKAYVTGFRRTPTQPPPEDDTTHQSLRHRQIISEEDDEWRMKVPLMQQWLETRG